MMPRLRSAFEAVSAALLVLALLPLLPSASRAAGESRVAGAFAGEAKAALADPIPPEALQPGAAAGCPPLLDFRVEDIRGRTVNLCAFRGKVLLIVNTASR
jgi:glutathione peroxidase